MSNREKKNTTEKSVDHQNDIPDSFGKSTSGKYKIFAKRLGIALCISIMLMSVLFFLAYTSSNIKHRDDPDPPHSNGEVIASEPEEELLSEHVFSAEDDGDPDVESEEETEGTEEPEEPEEPEAEPEPISRFSHVAYLTFDDGPSHEITPGILDILAREGIRATFFILPREGMEDLIQRILDEGHEIGNHSYSHNYNRLYKRGLDQFREDVIRADDFMLENFGYSMTSFRFPGGSMTWNRDVRRPRIEVIEELGYTYFDWHIDSGDAHASQADKGAQALTDNVLSNTNDIDHVIILMHDFKWRDTTLEALPGIIRGLRRQGYVFDILSNFPQS